LALVFASSQLRSYFKTLPRTFSEPDCAGGVAAAGRLLAHPRYQGRQQKLISTSFSPIDYHIDCLSGSHCSKCGHQLALLCDDLNSYFLPLLTSLGWPFFLPTILRRRPCSTPRLLWW